MLSSVYYWIGCEVCSLDCPEGDMFNIHLDVKYAPWTAQKVMCSTYNETLSMHMDGPEGDMLNVLLGLKNAYITDEHNLDYPIVSCSWKCMVFQVMCVCHMFVLFLFL